MDTTTSIYLFSIAGSSAIFVVLVLFAVRRRTVPGWRVFVLICLLALLFYLADALSVFSSTPADALFWFDLRFISLAGIPVVWLFLTFYLTTDQDRISPVLVALSLIIPLLTQFFIWTNAAFGLWVTQQPVFHRMGDLMLPDLAFRRPAFGFLLHVLYGYICLFWGIARVVYRGFRDHRLYRGQIISLSVGFTVVMVASFFPTFNIFPQIRINAIVPGLAVSSIFFALAMYRYGFLDLIPISRSLLIDSLEDPVFVLDARRRLMDYNPAFQRLLHDITGTAPRPGEPLPDSVFYLLEVVPGNDLENRRHLFPLITREKSEYYEISAIPIARSRQTPGTLYVMRNITQKHQTELELRQLTGAVEQSNACVVITDLNGVIEYVNPAFTRLTGYEFAEVKGKNSSILKSGNTPLATYQDLWSTLLRGEQWRGEFHNRAKDGRLFWESAIIAPVRDGQGIIRNYVAVKEDITERKMREQILKKDAETDPLTSLLNRRRFDLQLSEFLQPDGEGRRPLTLLVGDIDHFKKINDTHGHAVGDHVLRVVARRLEGSFRDADLSARIGGEEFAAILPRTDKTEARHIAERLRLAICSESVRAGALSISVSMSIGIAVCTSHEDVTPVELLRRADEAMYRAKQKGRNRIELFE